MNTSPSNSSSDVAPVVREPAAAPGLMRTLVAVVLGFFTFAATLTIGTLLVGLIFGPDSAYQGDTWRTTTALDIAVLLAGGLGAFMGGAVCRPIGGTSRIVPIFAAAMLLTVVLWLVMRHSAGNPDGPRSIGPAESSGGYSSAVVGPVVLYGLPIVACLMAYFGGSLANRVQRALFGR